MSASRTNSVGRRSFGVAVLLLVLCACTRLTPEQPVVQISATLVTPSASPTSVVAPSPSAAPASPSPARAVVATASATAAASPSPARPVITTPSATAPASPLPTPSVVALVTAAPVLSATVQLDVTAAHEQALIADVNALRAQNGLAAYGAEPTLSTVARRHSCDLAAHGLISHTSSDGRTLQERLGSDAGRWLWPSESIAAGTDVAAQVIALWLDEPPDGWHRRNLLDAEQEVVGVGYCVVADDPTGNHHYWTMIVTRPATEPANATAPAP